MSDRSDSSDRSESKQPQNGERSYEAIPMKEVADFIDRCHEEKDGQAMMERYNALLRKFGRPERTVLQGPDIDEALTIYVNDMLRPTYQDGVHPAEATSTYIEALDTTCPAAHIPLMKKLPSAEVLDESKLTLLEFQSVAVSTPQGWHTILCPRAEGAVLADLEGYDNKDDLTFFMGEKATLGRKRIYHIKPKEGVRLEDLPEGSEERKTLEGYTRGEVDYGTYRKTLLQVGFEIGESPGAFPFSFTSDIDIAAIIDEEGNIVPDLDIEQRIIPLHTAAYGRQAMFHGAHFNGVAHGKVTASKEIKKLFEQQCPSVSGDGHEATSYMLDITMSTAKKVREQYIKEHPNDFPEDSPERFHVATPQNRKLYADIYAATIAAMNKDEDLRHFLEQPDQQSMLERLRIESGRTDA